MSKEWVQLGPTGLAIRVFKNKKSAARYSVANPEQSVRLMDKAIAVGQIRRQVCQRDDWMCVKCGRPVVWRRGLPNSAEMDEIQSRGTCLEGEDGEYYSGEQSVANGQVLCANCHTMGEHAKQNRAPSFTKTSEAIL